MSHHAALTWSAMNVLNLRRYKVLCEKFTTLEVALEHTDAELLSALGCEPDTVERALHICENFNVSRYAKRLKKEGISFHTLENDSYPHLLRHTSDPPPFLYMKGSRDALSAPCIACVGTRAMSPYGKRVVERFIPRFIQAGVTTVSGLAYGIDALTARESLASGGTTVAVLGHGLGSIFPAVHRSLSGKILSGGGLLVSEYPLDVKPDRYTFPARNRIIAGLAHATVIFEAGKKSGALYTAEFALDDGRDVFAVPGQIFDDNFVGCHGLIAKSAAMLVDTPEEVLRAVGISTAHVPSARSGHSSSDDQQLAVFRALTSMPQSIDDLSEKLPLDAAAISSQLTLLELSRSAKNIGSGQWIRV